VANNLQSLSAEMMSSLRVSGQSFQPDGGPEDSWAVLVTLACPNSSRHFLLLSTNASEKHLEPAGKPSIKCAENSFLSMMGPSNSFWSAFLHMFCCFGIHFQQS
jgi:hypothetical protein